MINKLDIMCCFHHLTLYKNKKKKQVQKAEKTCSIMIIVS